MAEIWSSKIQLLQKILLQSSTILPIYVLHSGGISPVWYTCGSAKIARETCN